MNRYVLAALGCLGLALLPEALAQPTRIYLANDVHTDFMWTADADTYEKTFVEMLDFHLQLADETAANPPAFRNRFNADGSYWLWAYEQQKTPAEFARLIERIRDGTISAPLNTLGGCYGGQPAEAVLRGMYYAGRLKRRHGLRFRQAVAMENQTLPLGLASLWNGAGAEYSWRGVCACASRVKKEQLQAREHEIYWYTGHDGRRILMKWHSLTPAGNRSSGGYAEAFDPAGAVRFLDSDRDFLRRYRAPGATEPYRVRGAFGFGWDALDRKTGQPYAADPHVRARTAAGLDRTSAITLYRGSDCVEIVNELTANFADVRHWAFSFALARPAVRTEEVGAVILNRLKSAGGDYADRAARYDYVTVNHFADLTDGSGKRGVTISNPDLAFAKLGRSTVETLDTAAPQLRMLAGGQVDGPQLGIPAQNGQRYFRQRFALRPHGGYDQTVAMKFALEHQNPLVAGSVTGKAGGAYPERTHSLLAVSHPDVLLWALKVHDDGIRHGLVARVWNQSAQPARVRLSMPGGIPSGHRVTHIETPVEPLALADGALETTIGPQRMETFALRPSP